MAMNENRLEFKVERKSLKIRLILELKESDL